MSDKPNFVQENRIFKFTIPMDLVRNHPKVALEILKGCIVVRAQALFFNEDIEYEAWNEEFDEHPECCVPPTLYPRLIKTEFRYKDGSVIVDYEFDGWMEEWPNIILHIEEMGEPPTEKNDATDT